MTDLIAGVLFVAMCGILHSLMQEYPTLNRIVLIALAVIVALAFIGGLL